jgi:hypothetical protein
MATRKAFVGFPHCCSISRAHNIPSSIEHLASGGMNPSLLHEHFKEKEEKQEFGNLSRNQLGICQKYANNA